ncbi:MAG: TatD family hydrolase [Armatimonadota bacterium]
MQSLFDTHAHLNDSQLEGDIDGILARAADEGVDRVACVAWDMPSSRSAVEIAEKYGNVWATVGVHPHDAKTVTDESLAELRELSLRPKVAAFGEIGLDFYRDLSPRDLQEAVFRAQLKLAKELDMPVVIHSRDAGADTLRVIEDEGLPAAGGVMHCFAEDTEYAKQVIGLGMYIGVGGPVTYSKSEKLVDVVRAVPLESILIETDSPYMTPMPHRGRKINEPAFAHLVAEKIAELKGISFATVAEVTTANAMRMYRIKS